MSAGPNPSGLCMCGCGRETKIAKATARGNVKGYPMRYLQGHSSRCGTPSERFWEKVHRSEGCWEWTAHRKQGGYGQFNLCNGRGLILAPRFAWEEYNGPIPEGLNVLHRCDNPPCVRPDHLFLGTIADNQADMAAKGRSPRGEVNGRVKLTEDQVMTIRARYALTGVTQGQLADDYGVTRSNIGCIVGGKSWRHLPLEAVV